ncbi:hypothetical protein [uncultured Paraglaciecola sp.]|uniref:dioxygenase family protein n=1 Tax=uncultured Paraglaciecola sp. TaxID=1765024 RepID=UPI0030DB4C07|tara:strand:+ start:174454 stop:175104 length:651 start_codon:yes stop_codon:yes gene_type:complete
MLFKVKRAALNSLAFNDSHAIKLTLVIFILSVPNQSQGQVDPQWLKSWHQAVAMRPESVSVSSVIVSPNEPGIPLVVHGQIFKPDGQTFANSVLVHVYHRDHAGFDFGANDRELSTWRIQGWAKTDNQGKFEFKTIRPAADHLGREGGHFHFTVVSEEFGKQWMHKIHFLDDPKLSAREKQQSIAQGQFSWLTDVKTFDGIQHINVAFKLKIKADF